MRYHEDEQLGLLHGIYESMEFGEASDTMAPPEVIAKPIDPGKTAPKDQQDAYVAALRKWFDSKAASPAAPAKVSKPTEKMHKRPSPGSANEEEPGSGVKLNVDALLQDGGGMYWVSKFDQVLFLYRSPTETELGEPILHPDERQFRQADKIWIYRRFIKSTGELTAKGEAFIKNHSPETFDILVDNYLDQITSDKDGTMPDNTLGRSNAVLDLDEPLKEDANQGELDRRYKA